MIQGLFGSGGGGDSDSDSDSSSEPPYSSTPPPRTAAPVTGPARPIRFVYCDDKGKFRLDSEALATLQLVKKPVGVVAVCGRARQGKSFILNQLLGRSSGFQVAPTHTPCTKGLWLWSVPIKRTALDGTDYNLLLLDSEGIDAYDQTGTYSTQIFSLAVLLSSMFIYNQMGGIDEAALDRLSLVTEMTKHIRVRASEGKTTASELAQFSPIFVWLLRDFYLDLTEDNRKITPRDYLELALKPVQGGARDISAKNEIRESIRALFPERECFTLVRPVNNESKLQRLEQISLDKLRPQFKSGLDALTRFVFERTRPKQMGETVMNGPMLAGITQSFLDALNQGAVPTITSSWQSVEEAECRRAYDSATEEYMSSFDRSKPQEEAALRESHEAAVHKALGIFNTSAVGAGSVRQKYMKLLQTFFNKDYKRNAYMEADMKCANAIQNMERRLRVACNSADAKLEQVLKVLDDLRSEYEKSSYGPEKWHKLAIFLQQSLEGPIADLVRKRISSLQSKCSSLEERSSSLVKTLEAVKQESLDWKKKYENILTKHRDVEEHASAERSALKSQTSAAEARLAAATEQIQSAQEEAKEWKRKYDIVVRKAKAARARAAKKEEEVRDQASKIEQAEQRLATLSFELKDAEARIKSYDLQISDFRSNIKELNEKLDAVNAKAQSFEREAQILEQEKVLLEQKYQSEFARFHEVQERCKVAEKEAKRANEAASKARSDAALAQKEKSEIQQKAMESETRIERAERQIDNLERVKNDLANELELLRSSEFDASSKVKLLEAQVEEREKEIESLMKSNNEQRAGTVKVLEDLLEAERNSRAEANSRALDLARQLQNTQAKLDQAQQELTAVRLNKSALDAKLKTASHGKRARVKDHNMDLDSGENADITDGATRANKSRKSTASTLQEPTSAGDDDTQSPETNPTDYRKFTVMQLKATLTKHDFGDELLKLGSSVRKKDLIALYERVIVNKS